MSLGISQIKRQETFRTGLVLVDWQIFWQAWRRLCWFSITIRGGESSTMAEPELLAAGARWVALRPFTPLLPLSRG